MLLVFLMAAAACQPGNITSGDTCEPCIPGTFSSTVNATACTICPNNTYAPFRGMSTCLSCVDGYHPECDNRHDTGGQLLYILSIMIGSIVFGTVVLYVAYTALKNRTAATPAPAPVIVIATPEPVWIEEREDAPEYVETMRPLAYDLVSSGFGTFSFPNAGATTAKWVKRVMRDLASLEKDLPINRNSSCFVRINEHDLSQVQFMITGPRGTPYEGGCFLFDMSIPSSYLNEPPNVKFLTTGGGSVRFNPNLYNSGKVCLSILGTWSGPSWDPKRSTLLQVVVSIQGLVLVKDPYFNEPIFESQRNTVAGQEKSKAYSAQIRTHTKRWAIDGVRGNPPQLFKEVIENHYRFE